MITRSATTQTTAQAVSQARSGSTRVAMGFSRVHDSRVASGEDSRTNTARVSSGAPTWVRQAPWMSRAR